MIWAGAALSCVGIALLIVDRFVMELDQAWEVCCGKNMMIALAHFYKPGYTGKTDNQQHTTTEFVKPTNTIEVLQMSKLKKALAKASESRGLDNQKVIRGGIKPAAPANLKWDKIAKAEIQIRYQLFQDESSKS